MVSTIDGSLDDRIDDISKSSYQLCMLNHAS